MYQKPENPPHLTINPVASPMDSSSGTPFSNITRGGDTSRSEFASPLSAGQHEVKEELFEFPSVDRVKYSEKALFEQVIQLMVRHYGVFFDSSVTIIEEAYRKAVEDTKTQVFSRFHQQLEESFHQGSRPRFSSGPFAPQSSVTSPRDAGNSLRHKAKTGISPCAISRRVSALSPKDAKTLRDVCTVLCEMDLAQYLGKRFTDGDNYKVGDSNRSREGTLATFVQTRLDQAIRANTSGSGALTFHQKKRLLLLSEATIYPNMLAQYFQNWGQVLSEAAQSSPVFMCFGDISTGGSLETTMFEDTITTVIQYMTNEDVLAQVAQLPDGAAKIDQVKQDGAKLQALKDHFSHFKRQYLTSLQVSRGGNRPEQEQSDEETYSTAQIVEVDEGGVIEQPKTKSSNCCTSFLKAFLCCCRASTRGERQRLTTESSAAGYRAFNDEPV